MIEVGFCLVVNKHFLHSEAVQNGAAANQLVQDECQDYEASYKHNCFEALFYRFVALVLAHIILSQNTTMNAVNYLAMIKEELPMAMLMYQTKKFMHDGVPFSHVCCGLSIQ